MAQTSSVGWRTLARVTTRDGKERSNQSGGGFGDKAGCMKTMGSSSCIRQRPSPDQPCCGCPKT